MNNYLQNVMAFVEFYLKLAPMNKAEVYTQVRRQ